MKEQQTKEEFSEEVWERVQRKYAHPCKVLLSAQLNLFSVLVQMLLFTSISRLIQTMRLDHRVRGAEPGRWE